MLIGLSRQENSLCGPNSRSTHRRRRDSAIPPEIDTSCSAGDKQIVEDAPPLIGSHPSRCPDEPPGMARFERSTAVSDTIASSPRTYCPSCQKEQKRKRQDASWHRNRGERSTTSGRREQQPDTRWSRSGADRCYLPPLGDARRTSQRRRFDVASRQRSRRCASDTGSRSPRPRRSLTASSVRRWSTSGSFASCRLQATCHWGAGTAHSPARRTRCPRPCGPSSGSPTPRSGTRRS